MLTAGRRLAFYCPRSWPSDRGRFVVPYEVAADNKTTFHSITAALNTSGLASGDVIQIEPGSSPGSLINTQIRNVTNFTIQGDPAFAVSELPEVVLPTATTIDANRAGFTFKHLPLRVAGGTLTFTANGTVVDCQLTDDFRRLYAELIHRPSADAEVSAWVGSGLDLLSITALLAGSGEYMANG